MIIFRGSLNGSQSIRISIEWIVDQIFSIAWYFSVAWIFNKLFSRAWFNGIFFHGFRFIPSITCYKKKDIKFSVAWVSNQIFSIAWIFFRINCQPKYFHRVNFIRDAFQTKLFSIAVFNQIFSIAWFLYAMGFSTNNFPSL